MLLKTQQELDQIYSTTESIMSTSSRLSKSLSRDSQHLFLASTEPVLRNSVLISIDSERLSSAESSSVAEKDDSRCSQQNPFSETSRYVQCTSYMGSSPYANFISANFISANFISAIFLNYPDIFCFAFL